MDVIKLLSSILELIDIEESSILEIDMDKEFYSVYQEVWDLL